MNKKEVKAILEYGLSKGYKSVSEISEGEIGLVLDQLVYG